MMVQGLDTLSAERFNQQLCCNTAQFVEEEDTRHNYSAEPKPDILQEMPASPSEKKKFLGNILRRSSEKIGEKQDKKKNSSGIFSNIFKKSGDVDLRKSQEMPGSPSLRRSKEDVESDAYLMRLRAMDGRTDEEIAQFLATATHEEPQQAPTLASPTSPRKKNSSLSAFFSSVHQALKEEFGVRREDYFYPALPDAVPSHTRELTVAISAAPFFAAPPPETDMSFAELATYEPVYTNGDGCCINNLPVHKHDGTPLPGDQTTCSICVSAFEKKEDLKSLPCVHFFHKECIDRWLMVGHKCPVCKTLVL